MTDINDQKHHLVVSLCIVSFHTSTYECIMLCGLRRALMELCVVTKSFVANLQILLKQL